MPTVKRDPEWGTYRKMHSKRFERVLCSLPYREARAFVLRMGWTGGAPLTYRELGLQLGVSSGRANQIVRNAGRKLRSRCTSGNCAFDKPKCDPYAESSSLLVEKNIQIDPKAFSNFLDASSMHAVDLADAVGVSSGAVTRWRGKGSDIYNTGRRYLGITIFCKVCFVLNVRPAKLLFDADRDLAAVLEAYASLDGMKLLVLKEPRLELEKVLKVFTEQTGWEIVGSLRLQPVGSTKVQILSSTG